MEFKSLFGIIKNKTEQSRIEREPKISYHFLYAPHDSEEDLKKLPKLLEEADVYVPEAVLWTPDLASFLNRISQGNLSQKDREFLLTEPSYVQTHMQIIENSRKPIILVDMSAEEYTGPEHGGIRNETASLLFETGNFEDAIAAERETLQQFAEINMRRENIIKNNLKNKIREFAKGHPEFAGKELKVLVTLGAVHTKTHQELKNEGRSMSREFNEDLHMYDYAAEAIRRIMYGKEVSDELLAHALIQEFFPILNLREITSDENSLILVIRKLISQLSIEDIQEISERMKEGKRGHAAAIKEKLAEKGLKIPETQEEVEHLLGKASFLTYHRQK